MYFSEKIDDYEQFITTVDENTTEAIMGVDAEGIIAWWGTGAERLFGFTKGEALGRSIDIITPERFRGDHSRILDRVKNEGSVTHYMTLRKNKAGEELPIELAVGALRKDDEVAGLSLVMKDVSEHKKAIKMVVEAEKRYLSLFESSKDIIFSMDTQGRFASINNAFENVTDHVREDFIGEPFSSILIPWQMRMFEGAMKEVLQGKEVSLELTIIGRTGLLTVSFSIFPNKDSDGTIVGAWGIGRDVTERKLQEESLKTYAAELKRYSEELENSNHLKDLFIDIMRHDLLNPVGSINNLAELVLDDDLEPDIRRNLEFIRRNALKILEMIDNASRFSRLETLSEIEFGTLDVRSLLMDITKGMEHIARDKDMTLSVQAPPGLTLEASSLIEDVISNLVSNAIKYGADGTGIVVRAQEADDVIRMTVANQGDSIPEDNKGSIFERFTRIKKEGVKGTGLGLAIVKKVVEEVHGGRVWVEDNPGGGSIFFADIPKEKAQRKKE